MTRRSVVTAELAVAELAAGDKLSRRSMIP
jgi:hypothetical protein